MTVTQHADVAADRLDPLDLLARDDKWFVSGARALLYAPPFPLHPHAPGCWDPVHYLHFPFEPLYTFALTDEEGRELPLVFESRRWRPDRLTLTFRAPGLHLTETRVMTQDDTLVSRVCIESDATRQVHLVVWSAQPLTEGGATRQGEAGTATANQRAVGHTGYQREGQVLSLSRIVTGARQRQLDLALALAVQGARSYCVNSSQSTANHPHYRLTPFREKLRPDGLPNEEKTGGMDGNGLMYLGIERPIDLAPGAPVTLNIAASLAPSRAQAIRQAREGADAADPVRDAESRWRAYFAQVPTFRCSDPYLEKYYYYRWYGLRLNTIDPHQGHYQHPVVCEGIGYFRLPISYSMPVLAREARWMKSGELAHGILNSALDTQTAAGTFPAHLYLDWRSDDEIYHADWAAAFEAVQAVHPLPDLRRVYNGLSSYARFFLARRDKEQSGLFDIVNQWETGQEYMTRYFAADPLADEWRPMAAPLKGVDATVYLYRIFRQLASLAETLGTGEADLWLASAERSRSALLERCWQSEEGAFFDLGPDGQPTRQLSVTNFYPYLTDLTGERHLAGLRAHLLNPEEFWTPYPFPSSSQLDPNFSSFAEWKDKRHNCPWNGRTWPMTNSHGADILARASTFAPDLREITAQFVTRFVHMMFEDHDLQKPNSFEHYNPFTGHASAYRGVDDYMHSYVVDLMVRLLCGVSPEGDVLFIDPFPFGVDFSLEDVHIRGQRLSVHLVGGAGSVTLNGETLPFRMGEPLRLSLRNGGARAGV